MISTNLSGAVMVLRESRQNCKMEKFWTLKEGPRRIKARFWTTLHEIWKRRKKPFERLQEFGESSKDAKFGQIHGRKKKHQKYGF